MKDYTAKLKTNQYYHIYNHAVNRNNLFISENNYYFFLQKYAQYISHIV